MSAPTTRTILRRIGCPHLGLDRGEGYWYFTYDDGERYATRSVMSYRLNHMTTEQWASEGRALVAQMEEPA